MRHLTTGLLSFSLCLGAVSLAGCDNLPLAVDGRLRVSQQAGLKVLLGGDLSGLRQAQATVDDIHHVDIVLKTSASELTQSLTKSQLIDASASISFTNLAPGSATLKGIVYDTEGLILGEKTANVTLVSGETATTSLSIQLVPDLDHPAVPPASAQTSLAILNGSTSHNTAAVTTVAGVGDTSGYQEGTGANARFYFPSSVALDSVGNAYVADAGNGCVRKITPGGATSLIASGSIDSSCYLSSAALDLGRNRLYYLDFTYGRIVYTSMAAGGSKTRLGTVSVSGARAIATDRLGNVYVAHGSGNRVVKVSPSGEELPFSGSTASAGLKNPEGVAVDSAGYVFIADTGNHRIVKVAPDGTLTTFAGGTQGYADGTGGTARFSNPKGLAVDSNGSVYVADFSNSRIRKISRSGGVITVAGNSSFGFADLTGANARFSGPAGLTVDGNGVIYVADSFNHVVRKIQ